VPNRAAPSRWALAALLALPYLYYLSEPGVLGPDEARYAAIGQQMVASGDWITPVLWGEAWFEKPPLLYWLIASGTSLGLPDEWAIRLPVTVLALALPLLLPTWEAALALGTSFGWLALGQVAVTDIPLSVCFHLWLLLTLRQKPWLAGVFLGLAVLAKGLVPLVLAIPVAILYWRQWRHWVSAVAVSLPWYLLCYARNGQAFVDEFLIKHHVGRFFSPELQHVQPFWFYLPVLLFLFLPWWPALLQRNFNAEERPYLYTVLWGFTFFSLSTNKLPTYLLPLLPSLATLAAARIQPLHYRSAAILYALLPAFGPWVAPALAHGLSKATSFDLNYPLFALVVAAGGVAHRWPKQAFLGSFILSVLLLKNTVYPSLAGTVTAKNRVKVCVPEGSSRGYRYSLYYYAGREVPDCPSAEPER
jgi:4-amino-4-deoxy-L-arabinose transferase-like glycosyltransferase